MSVYCVMWKRSSGSVRDRGEGIYSPSIHIYTYTHRGTAGGEPEERAQFLQTSPPD